MNYPEKTILRIGMPCRFCKNPARKEYFIRYNKIFCYHCGRQKTRPKEDERNKK